LVALFACTAGEGGILATGELAVGDLEDEMLGHLAPAQHRADRQADLARALAGSALAAQPRQKPRQLPFGRRQQVLALARALGGELRIAADDEALARELLERADLISARSRSSNSKNCSGPSAAAGSWITGARRQEIQSSPAGVRSSRMRAEVIVGAVKADQDHPRESEALLGCKIAYKHDPA
jgi:hypothetical protein